MEGVVSEGTGTNAAISGVAVAGKTGTAEIWHDLRRHQTRPGSSASPRPNEPKIAIAVHRRAHQRFGGDVRGPIFKSVAEAILHGRNRGG